MSKRVAMILLVLLSLLGAAGTALSLAMFVMAILYGELGRVIFYFMLCVFSVELSAYCVVQLIKRCRQK